MSLRELTGLHFGQGEQDFQQQHIDMELCRPRHSSAYAEASSALTTSRPDVVAIEQSTGAEQITDTLTRKRQEQLESFEREESPLSSVPEDFEDDFVPAPKRRKSGRAITAQATPAESRRPPKDKSHLVALQVSKDILKKYAARDFPPAPATNSPNSGRQLRKQPSRTNFFLLTAASKTRVQSSGSDYTPQTGVKRCRQTATEQSTQSAPTDRTDMGRLVRSAKTPTQRHLKRNRAESVDAASPIIPVTPSTTPIAPKRRGRPTGRKSTINTAPQPNAQVTTSKSYDNGIPISPDTSAGSPVLCEALTPVEPSRTEVLLPLADLPTPESNHDDSRFIEIPPILSESIPLGVLLSDPHLRPISDGFAALASMKEKPEPEGQPKVWADGRQDLCEALPYYRAFNSAGHTKDGFARGFMFDGFGHPRDYMDSNVCVARAGGGLTKEAASGNMVAKENQNVSGQVTSVRNNVTHLNPVVLLSGSKNPGIQCKLSHRYSALSHFKVTHVWCEKSKGKRIFRYRFEKLDRDSPSWWRGKGTDEPAKLGELPAPFIHQCLGCSKASQQIYLNGWMCLQSECALFWKLTTGKEPVEFELRYDPRWLKQYTEWGYSTSKEEDLIPEAWALKRKDTIGQDFSWGATRAIVCPKCGRCGCRSAWDFWKCGNPACKHRIDLPHKVVPISDFDDWERPRTAGIPPSEAAFDQSLVCLHVKFEYNYRISTLTIPGIDGFITHMSANKAVVEERNGPDDMFNEMQVEKLDLKRRAMHASRGSIEGGVLCNHFTNNYGMPYKFGVAQESVSFEDAPKPVQTARSRLNWGRETLLKLMGRETGPEFNEVLAMGYMDGSKINYHDDGEEGLAPTIGTLSIGGSATMKLRMKDKHYQGATKTSKWVKQKPIPGCIKYAERLAAWESLQALQGSEPVKHYEMEKNLVKQLDLKGSGHAPAIISIVLRHGDMVFMHGKDMQLYYEHEISPDNKLRFALTARHIELSHLKPEEIAAMRYAVGPDPNTYDGSLPYVSTAKVSPTNLGSDTFATNQPYNDGMIWE